MLLMILSLVGAALSAFGVFKPGKIATTVLWLMIAFISYGAFVAK